MSIGANNSYTLYNNMMCANGLVKLIEELGELQQIVAKKLAYYDTDSHPDGKPIKSRLEEEIADVLASIEFVVETFELDKEFILERKNFKLNRFNQWHKDL